MMYRFFTVLGMVGMLCVGFGQARMPDFAAHEAVMDSLREMPPNMRFREMHRLGLIDRSPVVPEEDSGGLRLVGKWGGGPSVKVTGRDSVVFLSRGSEVVAVNFADPAGPQVLSHMQVNGLVSRSVLVDDRLYVGSVGSDPKYMDVFDVSDPAEPVRLGSIRTLLNDIAVQDTLVYAIGDDSLKIFDFADPGNPRLVGAVRDSGHAISVARGYAYVGDRWGLYVLDATDPANPRRVASWGTDIFSVQARNSICCVTTGNPNVPSELNFSILDVTDPARPLRIGYLANVGGMDMYLTDSLALLSGSGSNAHEFRILSIADSTRPRQLGEAPTPGRNWGVWAERTRARAFVADRTGGLRMMDITNLSDPVPGPNLLPAASSVDVCVDGDLAYIASSTYGMIILDIAQPDRPAQLGSIDSTQAMVTKSVAVRDSFAYMGWAPNRPWLRSVSVADPANPQMAGGAEVFGFPEAMVLRDSFLYTAQAYRFQVVNVARPREPVLVGSCDVTGIGLWLVDTLIYIASSQPKVVNVADPTNPRVVGAFSHPAWNLVVSDTVAFLSAGPLVWYNVADPTAPVLMDSILLNHTARGLAVVNNIAYVSALNQLHAVNVSDLHQPEIIATASLPYTANRIIYAEPYLYLSCWDAGVSIYETVAVGIAEPEQAGRPHRGLQVSPNPSTGRVILMAEGLCNDDIVVRDVAGRVVLTVTAQITDERRAIANLDGLRSGVYFVEAKVNNKSERVKLVIR